MSLIVSLFLNFCQGQDFFFLTILVQKKNSRAVIDWQGAIQNLFPVKLYILIVLLEFGEMTADEYYSGLIRPVMTVIFEQSPVSYVFD
jgi:hypothetical protein